MKKIVASIIAVLLFVLILPDVFAQDMKTLIDQQFKFAASQYTLMESKLPPDKMPRTFDNGELKTSSIDWWTSGFYPGSLWLIYEATHDQHIKALAEKRLQLEEKMQRFTGNHDIGFMIFCSFGNALRITGDTKYKQVIDTAAAYQVTRFKPVVKAIQSWNSSDLYTCPVIIDNMMNLEQLMWVSQHGGPKSYADIAKTHANTTLQNHFRADNSSFHLVDFDPASGAVIKKVTHQGLANNSAWARGQAWGLYGFTMMYSMTKDKRYLKKAEKVAAFLLHHPNLPADKIPYWDFNAPSGSDTYRDASAAAIIASALLELGQFSKQNRKEYISVAETILQSLSSSQYLSAPGANGGFILMHSVGSLPHKSEVDVPLTYADYYYLEALKRYKDWYLK